MQGIRFKEKLQLEEIITPISDLINGFYWILNSVEFKNQASDGTYFIDWEKNYDKLVVEQLDSQFIRLVVPGFFPKYAKYVIGDWDMIVGVKDRISLKGLIKGIQNNWIEENGEIYLSCVDAAYWEIYGKNQELLMKIKKEFPNSIECFLDEKKY